MREIARIPLRDPDALNAKINTILTATNGSITTEQFIDGVQAIDAAKFRVRGTRCDICAKEIDELDWLASSPLDMLTVCKDHRQYAAHLNPDHSCIVDGIDGPMQTRVDMEHGGHIVIELIEFADRTEGDKKQREMNRLAFEYAGVTCNHEFEKLPDDAKINFRNRAHLEVYPSYTIKTDEPADDGLPTVYREYHDGLVPVTGDERTRVLNDMLKAREQEA